MEKIAVRGKNHDCPIHGGGPIVKTQRFVSVSGVFVATVDSLCRCAGGVNDRITSGSSIVTINGHPVARMGDHTEHGGKIVQGVEFIQLD